MVALHNRRLTSTDLWPDLLWTDADWHRKRDEIEAQVRAGGIVAPYLFFEIGRRMEAYQRRFPSFGDRQRIMAAIYPTPKAVYNGLTDEEKDYLNGLLNQRNDPIVTEIMRKLKLLRDS